MSMKRPLTGEWQVESSSRSSGEALSTGKTVFMRENKKHKLVISSPSHVSSQQSKVLCVGTVDSLRGRVILGDGWRGKAMTFGLTPSKDSLMLWKEAEDKMNDDEVMTFHRILADKENVPEDSLSHLSQDQAYSSDDLPPTSVVLSSPLACGGGDEGEGIMESVQEQNEGEEQGDIIETVEIPYEIPLKVPTQTSTDLEASGDEQNVVATAEEYDEEVEETVMAPPTEASTSAATLVSGTEADKEEAEAEENSEDESDVFAEYAPLHIPSAGFHPLPRPHPSPLVETASLSAMSSRTPLFPLRDSLSGVAAAGLISAAQLESVLSACEIHSWRIRGKEKFRAGFALGDGAGVGKGRQLAALILDSWLRGRKRHLWFSVSTDLLHDARRDLNELGASFIPIADISDFSYKKIDRHFSEGVLFSTYQSLIACERGSCGNPESADGGKAGDKKKEPKQLSRMGSRFNQMLQWVGRSVEGGGGKAYRQFDGCIVLDEAHKAKSAAKGSGASRTGQLVVELQRKCRSARVVYASATPASSPKELAYFERAGGYWGDELGWAQFSDFESTLEKRGVAAMELLATDLKRRGQYLARTLSFTQCSYRVEFAPLSERFQALHAGSAQVWCALRSLLDDSIKLTGTSPKKIWSAYWGSFQRFFKALCVASKVDSLVAEVQQALADGKCAVIGIQTTGEAALSRSMDKLGTDPVLALVSDLEATLEEAVDRVPTGDIVDDDGNDTNDLCNNLGHDIGGGGMLDDVDGDGGGDGCNENNMDDENGDGGDDKGGGIGQGSDDDDDDDGDATEDERDNEGIVGEIPTLPTLTTVAVATTTNTATTSPTSAARRFSVSNIEAFSFGRAGGGGGGGLVSEVSEVSAENTNSSSSSGSNALLRRLASRKEELLQMVKKLDLPPSLLDHLIDRLGGPSCVAELSGRKHRVVRKRRDGDSDSFVFEKRDSDSKAKQKEVNLREKDLFMRGEKMVAIISDAASTGISLHADTRAINQARRVHITPELPWSADKAIQQFGRTHRSNQRVGPEYVLIQSNVAGENRFASAVAARMASLGAISKGDHRAGSGGAGDMSQFDVLSDGRYSTLGLRKCYQTIEAFREDAPHANDLGVKFLQRGEFADPTFKAEFMKGVQEGFVATGMAAAGNNTGGSGGKFSFLERASGTAAKPPAADVTRFLNRLLAFPLAVQQHLFDLFTACVGEEVKEAKTSGKYKGGNTDVPGVALVSHTEDLVLNDDAAHENTLDLVAGSTKNKSSYFSAAAAAAGSSDNAAGSTDPSSSRTVPNFEKQVQAPKSATKRGDGSSDVENKNNYNKAGGSSCNNNNSQGTAINDKSDVLKYQVLDIDRGMSWEVALEKKQRHGSGGETEDNGDGGELSFWTRVEASPAHGKIQPCLALVPKKVGRKRVPDHARLKVWKPNVPMSRPTMKEFRGRYERVKEPKPIAKRQSSEEEEEEGGVAWCETLWREWHEHTGSKCAHFGGCEAGPEACSFGKRVEQRHVLTGPVFGVWPELDSLTKNDEGKALIKVLRVNVATASSEPAPASPGGFGRSEDDGKRQREGDSLSAESISGSDGGSGSSYGTGATAVRRLVGLEVPAGIIKQVCEHLKAKQGRGGQDIAPSPFVKRESSAPIIPELMSELSRNILALQQQAIGNPTPLVKKTEIGTRATGSKEKKAEAPLAAPTGAITATCTEASILEVHSLETRYGKNNLEYDANNNDYEVVDDDDDDFV